jgi:argininosuccinate lyase
MAAKLPQRPAKDGASSKLWGGRFTGMIPFPSVESMAHNPKSIGATDPLMTAYNESIHFDKAFFAQDIAGSIAFARANVKTGILTQDEFSAIEKGFGQILQEWQINKFEIEQGSDEDIHTANERRLGEVIGKDIAGKLHTYA